MDETALSALEEAKRALRARNAKAEEEEQGIPLKHAHLMLKPGQMNAMTRTFVYTPDVPAAANTTVTVTAPMQPADTHPKWHKPVTRTEMQRLPIGTELAFKYNSQWIDSLDTSSDVLIKKSSGEWQYLNGNPMDEHQWMQVDKGQWLLRKIGTSHLEVKEAENEEELAREPSEFRGYQCPVCEGIFDEADFDSQTLWYCGSKSDLAEDTEDLVYTDCTPVQETVWWCANNCFNSPEDGGVAEPDIQTMYECPGCGEPHTTKVAALECCS